MAVDFWKDIDKLTIEDGVKVALELHSQNVVFNQAAIRELIERTGTTSVDVEFDASHLLWPQADPVAVIRDMGPLAFGTAAKDVRVTPPAAIYGMLDNRFRKLDSSEPRANLGGDERGGNE